MNYFVVGLGNPTEEYEKTRHNAGRGALLSLQKKYAFSDWKKEKGKLLSVGTVGNEKVLLILPETYMNASGAALKDYITSSTSASRLVVVHDDIDLPLGKVKISYSRGSGGHRGLKSIIRGIGTKDFTRIRIGIATTTPSGKVKKPKGEQKVLDYLMSDFTKKEIERLRKVYTRVHDALLTTIMKGKEAAMNKFN